MNEELISIGREIVEEDCIIIGSFALRLYLERTPYIGSIFSKLFSFLDHFRTYWEIDCTISHSNALKFYSNLSRKGYEVVPRGSEEYFRIKNQEGYSFDYDQTFLRKRLKLPNRNGYVYVDVLLVKEETYKELLRNVTRLDGVHVLGVKKLKEFYIRGIKRTIPFIGSRSPRKLPSYLLALLFLYIYDFISTSLSKR
ncbi:MAG: hypothetical protein J7K98_00325 [Candidatus Aenigmarchaeota archaeon]|nr:hypothetical protein [Candidatus Aenigmarchaeota archaeon]